MAAGLTITPMINERFALVMLDGIVKNEKNDPHHTHQFYKSIQAFADASVSLCREGKFNKLERFINVAFKLFREGNDTVRNGIVNVYLFTLSKAMDQNTSTRKWIDPFMPAELRREYIKMMYSPGM